MGISKTIYFKNTPIHFTVSGKGRAVVLLHGFLESSSMWDMYVKKLARTHKVITIDLPGHGESGNIGYVHTMDVVAHCVKHVLSTLKLRKYVLVGHSMGGYVAVAFAELFPENLAGIGLFHSTAQADDEEKKKNRDRAVAAVKANHLQFVELFFENLFAPENVDRLKSEITMMQKAAQKMSKQGIVNALEGMKSRGSKLAVLPKLNFPVLYILGKQDTRIHFDSTLKETESIKNKLVVALDNVGHMGFVEAPEECLKAIKKLIRKSYG